MASSSTARQNQTQLENAFHEIAPCSAPKSAEPWDIFINHRGPDVKKTLAATIYHKLHSMGLHVFLDEKALEAGDSIRAEIQHAITSATLHIALFSPNYAQSQWCLDELSLMLKTGKKIIPIFYHVDPSDLKYIDQGKGKYALAFSEHEKKGRYTPEKLAEWKGALDNSSLLSGYLVKNNEDEATVLKNIVNDALKIMKKAPLWVAEHPLGLDELVEEFESDAGEKTVNIRGIVGMGGSGKTTLAKELFNRNFSFFERRSFVFDVRDAASRNALPDKQKKLLADLDFHDSSFDHVDEGRVVLSNHLSSHPALIVLDDVDHIDQLNAFLPNKDKLGSHSLVIVTTRELGVLISWGLSDSCIYRMPGLNWLHAQQLFCWHAFLQPSPPPEFETLVEEFLKACDGLPLSLKVLGAQLYGRKSKDYWKSQLHKILRILPEEIQQRLKVSYDALDKEEREMFLDVACFFIGEEKDRAIAVWDGSGWSGLHGFETLVNKCLVELVEWGRFEGEYTIRMHDHLRDMGREIASRHSPYRLWCPQQIDTDFTEREPIRGIQPADSFVAFKKHMHRLMPGYYFPNSRDHCSRIYQSHEGSSSTNTNCFGRCLGKRTGRYKYEEPKHGNSIRRSERPQFSNGLRILSVRGNELTEEFATLSEDLVMLFWKDFPLRNVPSWLTLKNLRVLELDGADELEELWQNNADPPLQLSELILRNCRKLQWFPSSIRRLHHLKRLVADFPGSSLTVECWGLQSLENLRLNSSVLSSLPDGFDNFTSLRNIDLHFCEGLSTLPASFSQLIHLTGLDLHGCEMLSSLPDDFGNLTSLTNIDLRCCKRLSTLPASFSQLIHLTDLNLYRCEMLSSLPDDFGNLTTLRNINLCCCKRLSTLPASFSQLIHLTDLDLEGCEMLCEMLSSLPDDFGNLTSLTNINLEGCKRLSTLPASFSQLIHLTDLSLQGCQMLSSLPDDFGNLTSLTSINLYNCEGLSTLPASFSQLIHLTDLKLLWCKMLSSLPDDFGNLTSLRNIYLRFCKGLSTLPASFSQLIHLTDLSLQGCQMLSSLPDDFGNLTSLTNINLHFCDGLSTLPASFSQLIHLKDLYLSSCTMLSSLPDDFGNLTSLTNINLYNCEELSTLPASFSQLIHLTDLNLSDCKMLSSLPDDFGNLTSLRNIDLSSCKRLSTLPASFSQLIHLTDLKLIHCEMLSSLPETLPIMSLNNLEIIGCDFLKDVRCISGLINLETLEIWYCPQIEELPSFADLASLKRFKMRDCPKVEKIEGLEHAKSLKKLWVETFWELPGIRGLENVERLEALHLKCETISALKPCIPSIKGKECPRRTWIQGSVNHLKLASIVNSLELEFSDLKKVIWVPDDWDEDDDISEVPDDSNDSEVPDDSNEEVPDDSNDSEVPDDSNEEVPDDSNDSEVDDSEVSDDSNEDDSEVPDDSNDEDHREDDYFWDEYYRADDCFWHEDHREDEDEGEGDYYLYYAEKEKGKSKVVRIWYSVRAPYDEKQRAAEALHHYRLPKRLIVVSGKKQRVAEAFHQLLNLLE